MRVGDETRYLK